MTDFDRKDNSLISSPTNTEDVLYFADEKQRKIRDALLNLDKDRSDYCKKLAGVYEGIVIALNNKSNPDRIPQVSHSARELTNILPRYFPGIPTKQEERIDYSNENHRIILNKILDNHPDRRLLPNYLRDKFIDKWIELHTFFNKTSKHDHLKGEKDSEINEDFFYQKIREYEDLLYQLLVEKVFFNVIREIDKILKIKNPTVEDLNNLVVCISQPEHRRYFFTKCTNHKWLNLLVTINAFNKPQDPIEKDGYIQFPDWPESIYLSSVADKEPQKVYEIIKEIDTKNQSILNNFLDSALKSDIDTAVKYSKLVIKKSWIRNLYNLLLPDKISDLVIKLADNNKINEAIKLADNLLCIREYVHKNDDTFYFNKTEAKSYFDEWRYGEIVNSKFHILYEKAPVESISIFFSRIKYCISIEKNDYKIKKIQKIKDLIIEARSFLAGKKRSRYYEYSHIWRPNLVTSRNKREDVKNILIDGVISIFENNKDNKDALLKIGANIKKYKDYGFFRRLEMFLYLINPEIFKDDIRDILIDNKIIKAHNLEKEYLSLLELEYSKLDTKDQRKIKKYIKQGPNIIRTGSTTKEELRVIKNGWRLNFLKIINKKDDNYIKNSKDIINSYSKKTEGEIEVHTSWIGDSSPISSENLSKMDLKETINYLSSYKISDDFFERNSYNGLGLIFSGLVKENPNKYISNIDLYFAKKIRPIYIYNLIGGLKDAIRQGNKFNETNSIDLCYSVIVKNKISQEQNNGEQGIDSVKQSIADFMGEILGNSKYNVPFSMREKVWKIIEILSDDSDPTQEYEQKDSEGGLDPMTLAINTTRGEAINASISYGLWYAKNNKKLKSKINLMPKELELLLSKHLNIENDPSIAIRSVYGSRLPNFYYLNIDWLKENKEKIFSKNFFEYNVSAWEGYLFNGVIKEVYLVIKDHYKDFINSLGKIENKFRRSEIEQRFCQHLGVIYANSIDDDNDDLINEFFKSAPSKSKAEFINFQGRVVLRQMENFKDKDTVKKRLIKLWELRIIENKNNSDIVELREFGWWFKNSPLNKKSNLDLLTETLKLTNGIIDVPYEIAEELKEYAKEFPLESIMVLDLIVRSKMEKYEHLYKKEDYKEVIKICKESSNKEAVDLAEKLRDYLGSIGFVDDFKE